MHRWRAQKYGPLPDWAHFALETIRTINTPAFAGVLSALFAGEKLLAVRFGVRTGTVLHWWLPAYNPDLPSYAPGILLLLAMAERGPDLGITRIDLGKGLQDYKRKISQCFRHGGHRLGGCALLQHGAEDPPPDLSQLHSQHPPTAASGPPGKASALPDPANLRLIFRCAFSMSIPQPQGGGATRAWHRTWRVPHGKRATPFRWSLARIGDGSGETQILDQAAYRHFWARLCDRLLTNLPSGNRLSRCVGRPWSSLRVVLGHEDFDFPASWHLLELPSARPRHPALAQPARSLLRLAGSPVAQPPGPYGGHAARRLDVERALLSLLRVRTMAERLRAVPGFDHLSRSSPGRHGLQLAAQM